MVHFYLLHTLFIPKRISLENSQLHKPGVVGGHWRLNLTWARKCRWMWAGREKLLWVLTRKLELAKRSLARAQTIHHIGLSLFFLPFLFLFVCLFNFQMDRHWSLGELASLHARSVRLMPYRQLQSASLSLFSDAFFRNSCHHCLQWTSYISVGASFEEKTITSHELQTLFSLCGLLYLPWLNNL